MTEELLLCELQKKNIKVNKIIGNLDWAEARFSNGIIVHFDGYISDDEKRIFDGSLEGMVFSTRMHKGKREFSDCAEDFFDIESPDLIIKLASAITEYTKGKVSFSDFDSFKDTSAKQPVTADDLKRDTQVNAKSVKSK